MGLMVNKIMRVSGAGKQAWNMDLDAATKVGTPLTLDPLRRQRQRS